MEEKNVDELLSEEIAVQIKALSDLQSEREINSD